jgi:hypothetical protein
MWVYIRVKSEPNLFTVGFYDPSGKWQTDSDHSSKEDAAERCSFLNGNRDEVRLRELNVELVKALIKAEHYLAYYNNNRNLGQGCLGALEQARAALASVKEKA